MLSLLSSEQPRPAVFDLYEYQTITDASVPDKSIGTGPFMWGEYVPSDYFSRDESKNIGKAASLVLTRFA